MIPLEQLLARFKNLTNTEKVRKELIMQEITTVVGVPIKSSQISFSKNTIFLKVPSIIKTEILLKKNDILKKTKNIPGVGHIIDIK